jgi:adenylate cyclase
MVTTLKSFSKYVAPVVVQHLLSSKEEAQLQLVKQSNCVVWFMDIEDFTSLGETLTPENLVILISEVFEGTSNIIVGNFGIIDKYIGDCIMAFWREEDSARYRGTIENLACKSAVECMDFIHLNNKFWTEKGFPAINCRIGIHAGPVLMGK